ncbi:MAG TPA: SIS domain-containing protein [Phycisphaerales bacterium]|nr:SIS domain-containing protein [Phycisphaerales bacterium]
MAFDRDFIRTKIGRAASVIASLGEQAVEIERFALAVRETLVRGGAVFTFGNGGSAAEAMHLSEELIGRYSRDRAPKRAVCLNADPTALTCIANDFGYDEVFARQVRGLARAGDLAVAFSTSGKSPNITLALKAAKEVGAVPAALLGKGGGEALKHAALAVVVASDETEHIQEAHQVMVHLILEAVEAG